MERVLARRDDNWKKLQQYVLEEKEAFDLTGPGGLPLWGMRREYSWFIRQGVFVRSPVKANGVALSEADRRKAEDEWLRRETQPRRAAQAARRTREERPAAGAREARRRDQPHRRAGDRRDPDDARGPAVECRRPVEAGRRPAVRLVGVLPAVPVREGPLRPGRPREDRRPGRVEDRVLPGSRVVQGRQDDAQQEGPRQGRRDRRRR